MGVLLNPLFADGMVFAAGKEIRVFGEGNGKVVQERVGAENREGFSIRR